MRTLGPPGLPWTFQIDDEVFTVRAADDAVLLDILLSGDWSRIVPGLLHPEEQARLWGRARDRASRLRWLDLWRAATDCWYDAVGLSWHASQRLAVTAQREWLTFYAWCAAHGIDPDRLPVPRLLAAVYAWLLGNCADEGDLRSLEREVHAPPPVVVMAVSSGPPPRWLADYDRRMARAAASPQRRGSGSGR